MFILPVTLTVVILLFAAMFIWRTAFPHVVIYEPTQFFCYLLTLLAMTAVLEAVLTPIGLKLAQSEDREGAFRSYSALRAVVGAVFFIGYYAVSHATSQQFYGLRAPLPDIVPLSLAMWGLVWFVRHSVQPFGREGKSFLLKMWEMGVEALVFAGAAQLVVTFIDVRPQVVVFILLGIDVVVCQILQNLVLYKESFGTSPVSHLVRTYLYEALGVGAMFAVRALVKSYGNQYKEILLNGLKGVGIALVVCIVIVIADGNLRRQCKLLITGKHEK